jgi:hypothetical protein
MCAVSAVIDYGKKTWDWGWQYPTLDPSMMILEMKTYLELVEKAKKFDEIAKQPHCEDPEKAKLLEKIEARIQALEELTRNRIFPS